jgi:hypothetical protein
MRGESTTAIFFFQNKKKKVMSNVYVGTGMNEQELQELFTPKYFFDRVFEHERTIEQMDEKIAAIRESLEWYQDDYDAIYRWLERDPYNFVVWIRDLSTEEIVDPYFANLNWNVWQLMYAISLRNNIPPWPISIEKDLVAMHPFKTLEEYQVGHQEVLEAWLVVRASTMREIFLNPLYDMYDQKIVLRLVPPHTTASQLSTIVNELALELPDDIRDLRFFRPSTKEELDENRIIPYREPEVELLYDISPPSLEPFFQTMEEEDSPGWITKK